MDDITRAMSDNNTALVQHPGRAPRDESLADRIQRETGIIAKAHADIDGGHGVADSDMEAWLDKLDQDPEAPAPRPSGRPFSG